MRDRLGQPAGRKKGATDRIESDRPRQAGIEDTPDLRPERTAAVPGHISGANMHDSQGLEPLVRGIPPIRSRRGPRRRRPAKLHAPMAPTTTTCANGSASGIRHRIARKSVESSQRLGRHRWVVERTVSWLAGCRRLHRRYERKAEYFLAFVGIAATLIGYRRLTNQTSVRPIEVPAPVTGSRQVRRRLGRAPREGGRLPERQPRQPFRLHRSRRRREGTPEPGRGGRCTRGR